jgi:long-chain acyl-CoA synthetase
MTSARDRRALARWENEGGTVVHASSPPAPTLGSMALASAAAHRGAALRHKEGGAWRDTSYPELGLAVEEIALGLIALGIESGDHVALLSETRPEWTLADLATLCAGAVVVPVYQTSAPEEVGYVLKHSGARLVFCEDEQQLTKIAQVREDCPRLEHLVALTGSPRGAISLAELRERGARLGRDELERRLRETHAGDAATIVYTSGTTGPPKGCVLTHANLLATVRMYAEALDLGREPFSIFMFLPLAHVLARITQLTALQLGGTIVYWQRDSTRLLDDLAETGPTHFPSVPRVFEKIHARATSGIQEASAPKRALFRWALTTGAAVRDRERRGGRPGALLRARHALADRLVLSKVRGLFGGRLQLALTGAAPIGREVLDFFDACGVPILEGYGMTETCAAATLNTPAALRFGTVGRALPGAQVSLADDGEILLRGGNVFRGYYRDDGATAEIFEDGWLRSGDLGALDADGFLSITGRKKDIIITSSGKNVTPANIEAALQQGAWISHAVVYGDNRPYLVAALTLDPDEVPALAKRLGVEPDIAAMASHARVREALQAEVDAVNSRLARIEQIKRFAVLDRDLTQGAGELTPTLKVKRNVVYDRYRDIFEGLYTAENGDTPRAQGASR